LERTANVTVAIDGVPNHVALGDLQVQVEMTALFGYPPGENILVLPVQPDGWAPWERVYFVDRSPTGLQQVPWTDLLDFSCDWAFGVTGKSLVRRNITLGLFWAGNWVYDPAGLYFWMEPSYQTAYLTKYDLTKAVGITSDVNMDCRDAAGFCGLSIMSLGYDATFLRVFNQDVQEGLRTNLLCGIGNDASVDVHPITGVPTYTQYNFNFHQIAYASGVFDAAAAHKVDLSGSIYRNTPYGWPLSGYWQTPHQYGYYGLVFGVPSNETAPAPVLLDYEERILDALK
jgi:hypothetical protein